MNEYFLGVLNAGYMTLDVIEKTLSEDEILLEKFEKSSSWHTSSWHGCKILERFRSEEIVRKLESGENMSRSCTWWDFWNKEHKIYVSSRHKKVHYEAIAHDVLELLPKNKPLMLLDFGCGDALCAPTFVDEGLEVLLYDPIPFVQERIKKSFSNILHINVAESLDDIHSNPVDVVLINSVLQYIPKKEFASLLPIFKKIMKADGLLIIADVVPADMRVLQDVISLMRNAWRHHFVFPAVRGLVATLFSDYRSTCHRQGFATYSEKEMLEILSRHNFVAERKQNNVGLTSHRMTFCAKLADSKNK